MDLKTRPLADATGQTNDGGESENKQKQLPPRSLTAKAPENGPSQ